MEEHKLECFPHEPKDPEGFTMILTVRTWSGIYQEVIEDWHCANIGAVAQHMGSKALKIIKTRGY